MWGWAMQVICLPRGPWPRILAKLRRKVNQLDQGFPLHVYADVATCLPTWRGGRSWETGGDVQSSCACCWMGMVGQRESPRPRRILMPGPPPHYQSSRHGQWSMRAAPEQGSWHQEMRLASDSTCPSPYSSLNPHLLSSPPFFLGVSLSERD